MSDERRIDELAAPGSAHRVEPDVARRSESDGVRRSDVDSTHRSELDGARRFEGAAARETKPSIERVVVRSEKITDRPADQPVERNPDRSLPQAGRENARGSDRNVDRGVAHEASRALDAATSEREESSAPVREPRRRVPQPDILTIDEAAELLGVSIKTFNKVLHNENMPARKIGREWKFSRQALIDWVGSGQSQDFYRESSDDDAEEADVEIKPQPAAPSERPKSRRTAGWQIEFD